MVLRDLALYRKLFGQKSNLKIRFECTARDLMRNFG
jgi:hypothetical protein